jgi:hypothetical protein
MESNFSGATSTFGQLLFYLVTTTTGRYFWICFMGNLPV